MRKIKFPKYALPLSVVGTAVGVTVLFKFSRFGLVKEETNRLFVYPVNDRSSTTLLFIILKLVVLGATIYSDAWAAYLTLNMIGYRHFTVVHKKAFVQQYRDSMGGLRCESTERIPGRTVVITGANSGLGKETAKELAKRGGRIIMACRDMGKCEEARKEVMEFAFNTNVHCRKLDMSSIKSIHEFSKNIKENEKRLDILINNAGVMCPPKRTLTEDGFELQLGVNYLGPFLLTHLLLDKLKESALPNIPCRIINITSYAYASAHIYFKDLNWTNSYNPKLAYSQSKLAILLFSQELAKKLEGTNVNVYAVNPGVTRTNLGRYYSHEKSTVSSTLLGPLWWFVMKTPQQGCQTTLCCALESALANSSGKLYSNCEEREADDIAHRDKVSQRLWLISERWTRLVE